MSNSIILNILSNSKANALRETMLKVVSEKKPQSVEQLMVLLKESGFEENRILDCVQKLQAEGLINLEDATLQSRSPPAYKLGDALWYFLTIAAGAITSVVVFAIPDNVYPWVYVRNFFGAVFVLFLPGYAFVKAVFRFQTSNEAASGNLERIERIALSTGMSIAIVVTLGLLLYYSPFGLNLIAIVLSLFVFTSVFATAALLRDSKVR